MSTHRFKVGDHVRWNPDDPRYGIRSDRTDHVAVHKGGALHRV